MENIIVEEGGSVERLLSSEVFMAWMIFIKLYFGLYASRILGLHPPCIFMASVPPFTLTPRNVMPFVWIKHQLNKEIIHDGLGMICFTAPQYSNTKSCMVVTAYWL